MASPVLQLVLVLAVSSGTLVVSGQSMYLAPSCRSHTASLAEFGGVGDGTTSNTAAFRSAVEHLSQYSSADGGGAMLYVPAGRWLTGPFNLTSHFTLFLHSDAVILGSPNISEWPVIAPLPSYGRGRDKAGGRYASLIGGSNLTDVVITGNNGTIDGQGGMWWSKFHSNKLKYTRGYLVELMWSESIFISNVTLLNSPAWNIHPVYSSFVVVQGVTILAPTHSPNTDGINPDSWRRLRGHQERLGRVRHRRGHAVAAHRHPPPHLRVPDQRRHRHRQRDVGRRRRRARRGHRRRAHQDGRGEGRVREGRVREADDADDDEAGVLDDGGRPQRRPRGGQHQLPGRRGHGRVQGGRQAPRHRRRALQGHLHRQRHGGAHQVQEVPLDVRRRRGRRSGGRHPGALRRAAATGRQWRMPVPDGHAAHRQGHRPAVRIPSAPCTTSLAAD